MNKENPTHVEIMKIGKDKKGTFKTNNKLQASVVKPYFVFTEMILRDIDYMMISDQYTQQLSIQFQQMVGESYDF